MTTPLFFANSNAMVAKAVSTSTALLVSHMLGCESSSPPLVMGKFLFVLTQNFLCIYNIFRKTRTFRLKEAQVNSATDRLSNNLQQSDRVPAPRASGIATPSLTLQKLALIALGYFSVQQKRETKYLNKHQKRKEKKISKPRSQQK